VVRVESSMINSIFFADGVLFVQFRNGSIYRYEEVPRSVYDSLLQASSKGKYFLRNVRDLYPTTKIREKTGR